MANAKFDGEKVARGLGWFSIGLGLAELLAPRELANLIGMEEDDKNSTLLRAFGARELLAGVGILTRPKPTGWLWARVAGDALDVATLGMAANQKGANKGKLLGAFLAVAPIVVLDIVSAIQHSEAS